MTKEHAIYQNKKQVSLENKEVKPAEPVQMKSTLVITIIISCANSGENYVGLVSWQNDNSNPKLPGQHI